jgi:hypothetical protein
VSPTGHGTPSASRCRGLDDPGGGPRAPAERREWSAPDGAPRRRDPPRRAAVRHGGRSRLEIHVSDTGDWRANQAIAVHELTEALLCLHRGISVEAVDAWDTGLGAALDEPGDDPRAPYYREHQAATVIEYQVLKELGMPAEEYERVLERLSAY